MTLILKEVAQMKRLICIAAALCLLTACSTGDNDQSSGKSSLPDERRVQSDSEQSKQESKEKTIGTLLENSFKRLYESGSYYIDAYIITDKYGDNKSELTTTVACDAKKNRLSAVTKQQDEVSGHILLSDNKRYIIDDENMSYTVSEQTDSAQNIGKTYTTGIYMGLYENLILQETKKKEYTYSSENKKEMLDCEVYSSGTPDEKNDISVIYYFSGAVPAAEIIETKNGTTVFEFNAVSEAAPDESIFDLPGASYTQDNT